MKMTVKTKLIIEVATIILLLIAITSIGTLRITQINDNLTLINDVNAVQQRYAINFRGSVHDRAIRMGDYILYTDQASKAQALAEIESLAADYQESAQALDAMFSERSDVTDEERARLADIKASEAETLPLLQQVLQLDAQGRWEDARRIVLEQARPAFNLWLDRINAFIDLEEAYNKTLTDETRTSARHFQHQMMAATVLAIIAGAVLAVWILKAIKPLSSVTESLNAIAQGEGDLTAHIAVHTNDEIGKVAANFNTFISTLHRIISTVKQSVMTLSNAGQELQTNMIAVESTVENINDTITQVRSQITGQSEKVTDVSETMQKINSDIQSLNGSISRQSDMVSTSSQHIEHMVNGINDVVRILENSAEQFNTLSSTSANGYEKVTSVYQKVIEISEKSHGVSDANTIINSIASQTNLLAMNAAIEAAHAGEAGQGFAVVADEIRKLAENSAKQSKSISAALKDLMKSINEVVDTALIAGESFEQVIQAVSHVTEEQTKIRTVMEEQSYNNQQVAQSFETMQKLNADVTQGAERMSQGSQNVLHKTAELVEITSMITASMDNMTSATHNIQDAMQNMTASAATTETGIATVREQIDSFIL